MKKIILLLSISLLISLWVNTFQYKIFLENKEKYSQENIDKYIKYSYIQTLIMLNGADIDIYWPEQDVFGLIKLDDFKDYILEDYKTDKHKIYKKEWESERGEIQSIALSYIRSGLLFDRISLTPERKKEAIKIFSELEKQLPEWQKKLRVVSILKELNK